MNRVLFVCVHNSGRSQMAEALFNRIARKRGVEAHAESTGTDPAERVNTKVAQVMSEIGIDISESKPRRLTDDMVARSDEIITMGCAMDSEQCPSIRLEKVVDWQLRDPSVMDIDDIRRLRETIRQKVESILDDMNPTPARSC